MTSLSAGWWHSPRLTRVLLPCSQAWPHTLPSSGAQVSLALETTGTCHIDPRLISLKTEGPVLAGLACSQVGFGFGFSCLEQRELDLRQTTWPFSPAEVSLRKPVSQWPYFPGRRQFESVRRQSLRGSSRPNSWEAADCSKHSFCWIPSTFLLSGSLNYFPFHWFHRQCPHLP